MVNLSEYVPSRRFGQLLAILMVKSNISPLFSVSSVLLPNCRHFSCLFSCCVLASIATVLLSISFLTFSVSEPSTGDFLSFSLEVCLSLLVAAFFTRLSMSTLSGSSFVLSFLCWFLSLPQHSKAPSDVVGSFCFSGLRAFSGSFLPKPKEPLGLDPSVCPNNIPLGFIIVFRPRPQRSLSSQAESADSHVFLELASDSSELSVLEYCFAASPFRCENLPF